MIPNELPTSIEELRQFALDTLQQMKSAHDAKEKLQREVIIAKQQAIELTSTVEAQKKRLEQSERTIKELLQALKGKKRERLDPNQLLLFDLGELEQLLEEAAKADDAQANDEASSKSARRRKKKKRPTHHPRQSSDGSDSARASRGATLVSDRWQANAGDPLRNQRAAGL